MPVDDWDRRFLEEIFAQPQAREPRLRYGAELRGRGDPLGELIGREAEGDRPRAQFSRAELWPRLRGRLDEEVTLLDTWLGLPKTVRGPLRAPCDALRTVERVEGASTLGGTNSRSWATPTTSREPIQGCLTSSICS